MSSRKILVPGILFVAGAAIVCTNAFAITDNTSSAADQKKADFLQNRQKAREETRNRITERICERLTSHQSKIEEKMTIREKQLENSLHNRLGIRTQNREKRDKKLETLRAKMDKRRTEFYVKIQAKVQNDDQQEALNKFKSTIEEAVKARREAVNAAIAAFRDGVDQAIGSKQSDIDSALSAYQAAVKSAFTKAQSDCQSGKDPKQVQNELRANLQSARENLKNDREKLKDIKTTLEKLTSARKAAIKKAFENFKAIVQEAVKELENAFPAAGSD